MRVQLLGRLLTRHSTRVAAIVVLAAAIFVQAVYLPLHAAGDTPDPAPVTLIAAESTLCALSESSTWAG